MGINSVGGALPHKPASLDSTSHTLLQETDISNVLAGLGIERDDIKKVKKRQGVNLLGVSEDLLKQIKDGLASIETVNPEEMKQLMNLFGINPNKTVFVDREGGYYIIEEGINTINVSEEEKEENT